MPDAFVTGGSGFIGSALIRRLAGSGRRVLALARSESSARLVAALGAEPVRGDLLEPGEWREGMRGCDTLFHVAGKVAMCDPEQLRINVEGTRAAVGAAAAAGVRRVVHTSSLAAIGEPEGAVATESTVPDGRWVSRYAESKWLAERAAFDAATRLGVDLVAVNPSSVQGPGRVHGSARIFIDYLNGRLRWAIRTRLPLVSIGDTVEAHLLAETSGAPGERYLVCGWNPTVEEAVALLAVIGGVEHRVRYLPPWMLMPGATVAEAAARIVGRTPRYCRDMARSVRRGHRCDGSRAERDLGLRYAPPEVWLAETVDWYRDQGVLDPTA
ncbi:MAG: NAD-dependent epimerase/dehydratase family protein [Acidimicrobiia bacterium]|nr:MAG: NAD-dependent epimerase/dehydratase family protein [Acidimicrobiia bacterium]